MTHAPWPHETLYTELLQRLITDLTTLPDKPEETPATTLRALWHTAAGMPTSAELAADSDLPPLDVKGAATLRALMQRRIDGIPLAHITGRQRFIDMEMLTGPGALVPRKETELLARTAIDVAKQIASMRENLVAVDICTGSGNIALAIAKHVPTARVFAADISADAIDLARRNMRHLALETRVEFAVGDLLAPFDTAEFHGSVDVLTCNPPYIASAKVKEMPDETIAREPLLAFDGGLFGVTIILRLIQDAPRFLRPGGWLVCEIGLGQGPVLGKILKANAAFKEVQTIADPAGAVRVIKARI